MCNGVDGDDDDNNNNGGACLFARNKQVAHLPTHIKRITYTMNFSLLSFVMYVYWNWMICFVINGF